MALAGWQYGYGSYDSKTERVQHWLSKGARPSDSVRTLLAKHLDPATVAAEISRDGVSFTTLETFGNVAVSRSYDISAYLSGATR